MVGAIADAGTLYGFLHGPQPLLLPGESSLWTVVLWTVVGFVMGSLPLAVLLARLFARRDPREVGDHYPGSANAWRVAGPVVGLVAVILEGMKGFVPVALSYWRWHVTGWAILPIMVAPLLGHMFSPFLRGRGGKGIAVTFGVWMGLTVWRVPMFFGLVLCVLVLFVRLEDAWTLMLGWSVILVYLLWAYPSAPVLVTGITNYGLLIQRHMQDLHPPFFKRRRER
ncbi:MAG: glycerol-3-phosphate acyltransferase [Caldiserica bacterium]|nr:glycerol-3-phosphate acyltransferase [Caldisericota bacterium]